MKSVLICSAAIVLCAGSALAVETTNLELGNELTLVAAANTFAATAIPSELTLAAPELTLAVAAAQAAKAAEAPAPEPATFADGWKFSAAFGLNGSSGNSENLNLRAAFDGVRKAKDLDTSFGLVYSYATDKGNKSQSRGAAFVRNDWSFGESPWFIYALGKAEYDEFQAWDWRVSAFVGPGYRFIKNETTTLNGRVGVGLTREVGGPDNSFTPELDIGIDFTHKFSERTKMFVTLDYYPSLERITDYRATAKAGLDIMVDPELALSLKIGVEDRYQSDPGQGFKKNDVDYFIMLAVAF